ncbi:MAG TPA: hypothetical protein ACFYDZ_09835 [Candidatus Brocadiaceae bacterium]
MKGDTIPEQNHIARYCKPTQVSDGQIQATAFMLRKQEYTFIFQLQDSEELFQIKNEMSNAKTIEIVVLKNN